MLAIDLSAAPNLVAGWMLRPRLREVDGGPLPPGTSIRSEYERIRGPKRLLIAGEPGSGKTSQLLELADSLLDRPPDGPSATVPLVLLLSTWRDPSQPFLAWVLGEIDRSYRIGEDEAARGLRAGDFALMLDGLDELPAVKVEPVDPRVAALDEFLTDNAFTATTVVLSCRSADYDNLGRRLAMAAGLVLMPLSPAVVTAALSDAGPATRRIATRLDSDDQLKRLLQTPLAVTLLILAFVDDRDASGVIEPPANRPLGFRDVITLYVESMLARDRPIIALPSDDNAARAAPTRGHDALTPAVARDYLGSLAALMAEHNGATILRPDELTPEWLPEVGCTGVLVPGYPAGVLGWLTRRIGLDHASTGLIGSVLSTSLGTVFIVPIAIYALGFVRGAALGAALAVLLGGAVLTAFGFTRMQFRGHTYAAVLEDDMNNPIAAPKWLYVWERAIRWLPVACALGTVAGIVVGFARGWIGGLLVAGSVVIASLPATGVRPDLTQPPAFPGQALRASSRALQRVYVAIGLVTAVASLAAGLAGLPWTAIAATGPLAASLSMVTGPGRAWLRTRALVYGGRRSRLIPADLVGFLEFASERALLRRAGGGYLFFHDGVQRYFADEHRDRIGEGGR